MRSFWTKRVQPRRARRASEAVRRRQQHMHLVGSLWWLPEETRVYHASLPGVSTSSESHSSEHQSCGLNVGRSQLVFQECQREPSITGPRAGRRERMSLEPKHIVPNFMFLLHITWALGAPVDLHHAAA